MQQSVRHRLSLTRSPPLGARTSTPTAPPRSRQAVSDIVRTTLGPKSMLKMLLDPMGGIVITNDGNAILREIDVAHPAAKSMLELSRSQDEEVGDGTTSVIILAGELLSVSEPFLAREMHPTVIVNAYHRALDFALQTMEKLAVQVNVSDKAAVTELIRSCIGTKFTSRYGDMIADLALEAVLRVTVDDGSGRKEIDIKRYAKVEKCVRSPVAAPGANASALLA